MAGQGIVLYAAYGMDKKYADATAFVASRYMKGQNTFTADNATFGDPNPGVLKALVIVWAYTDYSPTGFPGVYPPAPFQIFSAITMENRSITLPSANAV